MCSIYGAYSKTGKIDHEALSKIRQLAKDRGRDGGRHECLSLENGTEIVLGNWRATPTTEIEAAPSQPYGGIVHNGTIANDKELGGKEGDVDSMVLQKVLDRTSLAGLVKSLGSVKGSYALGISSKDKLYLATNYKPIYLLARGEAFYFSSMERHLLPLCKLGQRPQRIKPYTAMDLSTGETLGLRRENNLRSLVICSSGLDSTTVAYMLKDRGYDVSLLHFTYGCKAETREAELVRQIAADLNCEAVFLPIDYSQFQGSSPLLTDGDIAGGEQGAEFAHEWVPARNLVMIAHAVAYAEANGFGSIALGNNLEESGAYPDNEEEFTNLLNQVLDYAVHDGGQVRLLSPVGHLMKHEIVKTGMELGVPYELSWSCYRGGEKHCGQCGPCFMRREAFRRNKLKDPTIYETLSAA